VFTKLKGFHQQGFKRGHENQGGRDERLKPLAKKMAEAGFCYRPAPNSPYHDNVKCYHCGIELYDWERNEIPSIEHKTACEMAGMDCSLIKLKSRPDGAAVAGVDAKQIKKRLSDVTFKDSRAAMTACSRSALAPVCKYLSPS
jgi:hypothetical protein